MSCSKAVLWGSAKKKGSASLRQPPSLLRLVMNLLGLSSERNWRSWCGSKFTGLGETPRPRCRVVPPPKSPHSPASITWGWAPERRRSPQASSHSTGPGSQGSSWQGAERSVNPQPPKGTLTQHRASVLPMGAPGYAKTFIIQLQCRANSWEALSPFTIPPASPALSALTSCSLSAAGSEPRAPWPHRGGRPAAGTRLPCPAPGPGVSARPLCPGHIWGWGRAQCGPSSRPHLPWCRLVQRMELTRCPCLTHTSTLLIPPPV